MYYTVAEISEALNTAKSVISDRTINSTGYTRGYNDCWSFVVEYDKALRSDSSNFKLFEDLRYKGPIDFFIKIRKLGYKDYMDLAIKNGYKIITHERPQHGDIGFEFLRDKIGTVMIADNGSWVSTSEYNEGITIKRAIKFKETLNMIARPIKG